MLYYGLSIKHFFKGHCRDTKQQHTQGGSVIQTLRDSYVILNRVHAHSGSVCWQLTVFL